MRRIEDELLIRCARAVRTPENERRIGALLKKPLDWDYLLETSGDHGREKRCDRFGHALRKFTEPNESAWIERPLPQELFPVYHILRPFRLTRRYGQRLFRRYPL